MADFELISRRALDPFHYRIFRYHFVLGADWKLCCRRLGVERGYFFHAVYRIEETLGKAFCETEPYALYPPSDYFVVRRSAPVEPCLPRDASREAGKVPRRLLARRADREQRLSA